MSSTQQFTINFDYRCPFARNANEHVVSAIRGGADYDVKFIGFSLSQAHVEDGGLPVWEDPAEHAALVPVAAGIVIRDKFPDAFFDVHMELFAARHDRNEDLRDEAVVKAALRRANADADAVFAELASGWPFDQFRTEHEWSVSTHQAFGVPTFIVDDQAAFVRLMTRPNGDQRAAKDSIDRVLQLVTNHHELNELKHTTIPR